MFSEYCDFCGESIGVDQGQMSHDGQHWHATDECFSCSTCRCSLLGKRFLPKRGLIYCSIACSKRDVPGKSNDDDEDEISEASHQDDRRSSQDAIDYHNTSLKFVEAPSCSSHEPKMMPALVDEMRPPPRPYQKPHFIQPPALTPVESILESSESEEETTMVPTGLRREREMDNSLSSHQSQSTTNSNRLELPPKVNTVRFESRRPDSYISPQSQKSTRSHERNNVDTRSIRSSGELMRFI